MAPALNNIGVYHHRRGDYGTAVNFFTKASVNAPGLTEAYYNLSQAHTENFNFTEAHPALAKAKKLDSDLVALWDSSEGAAEGNVIPINGGLRRAEEVLNELWPDLQNLILRKEPYGPKAISGLSRDSVLPGCGGEAVGIAQVVGQVGKSKPAPRTPLPGLYLVGCDAGGRGAGTHQAVDSGFNVAAMVNEDLQ